MNARGQARTVGACLVLLILPGSPALAEQPSPFRIVGTHAGGIASTHFCPQGKLLATGGGDKMIRLWDVAQGKQLHQWKGPSSFTCAVRFSPDGKLLAAAGYETRSGNPIYLYDVQTHKELPHLAGHLTGGIRRLVFHPEGKMLISAGFDGFVRVWDLQARKEVRAIKVEHGTVYSIDLSSDGKLLATAGQDGLKLWEFATGKRLPREGMGRHSCVSVAIAPDRKLVASGDSSSVKIWEVATGKVVQELKGFKGEVSQILFSRDGRRLFSGSYDRLVRIWEVRSGALLHAAEGHTGWVWGIALDAQENQLVSCSVDTKLLCWELGRVTKPAVRVVVKLTSTQVEKYWADLTSSDAGAAYRAICALADDPQTSVPLLKKRLGGPTKNGPSSSDIARLIRELDADVYLVREEATKQLAQLGVRALPALQKTLSNPPSLEVKKRAQRLVARLDPTELPPEELLVLRGVQTLEYIASREARGVLEQWSQAEIDERLSDEASQALARLQGTGVSR